MKKQRGPVVFDKILDAAERLFYNQGYNSTGINQVIEEADIAKASLYKHFDSKTDLMVKYVQRFHQRWFEHLESVVSKAEDPKQKLLAIFDHHSERQHFRGYGGCPLVKANNEAGMDDPRILNEIQQAKQRLKEFILKLVSDTEHKGILSDTELAETIYLMTEGGITAASIFKQSVDLQNAKKIIAKLI